MHGLLSPMGSAAVCVRAFCPIHIQFEMFTNIFKWLLILKVNIETGTVAACNDGPGKPLLNPEAL